MLWLLLLLALLFFVPGLLVDGLQFLIVLAVIVGVVWLVLQLTGSSRL